MLQWTGAGLLVLFALIQLIPYGRDHVNPPVTAEPSWAGSQTRALAVRACFSCHSNETHWPWYSNIAPFSWLTQRDVDNGREALNFSEWNRDQKAEHLSEVVLEGEMPPFQYRLINGEARLSEAERTTLAAGLDRTLERSPAVDGGGHGGGDGDGGGPGPR